MATYTKFQAFIERLAEKEHNLTSDTLAVALTNTAPSASADSVLTDISEITYTYCSTRTITTTSGGQTSGTYKLILTDLVLTASGGSVGPFQYVVVYNDTHASKGLIAYYDYGSAVTLAAGETFTIDFDGTNGFLQLA